MQAAIPVIICGIAIEELATVLGISYMAALALYFGWTQAKTTTEQAAVSKAREKNKDEEEEEIHLAWT